MLKVAVDVGFGRTKALASNGRQVDFPSVVGEFRPVRFSSGMEKAKPESRIVLDYNHKSWFVGEAALRQSTPQGTVDKERTVSEEGLTLLLAAINMLADRSPEIIHLVVGLPVMHYEQLKSRYQAAVNHAFFTDFLTLSGNIESSKTLVIEEVKVLPQPFGTLFDCLLDKQGDLVDLKLATGKIGIVDIGYNTLDLARADALEFINPRSTSLSGLGMFSAFQILSNEIYRSLNLEIPPERLEPLIRLGEVQVSGRRVSIEQYKIEAFRAASEAIMSRIKSVWPDRWELDRILITGGGAIALGEYLLPALENQAVIAPSPVFANVSGYLKFAHRVWRE